MPLPKLATEPFVKLWEQEVFKLLLAEGKITKDVVQNIRSWSHSGFSVDQSVGSGGRRGRGPTALGGVFPALPLQPGPMIEVTEQGKVLDKTKPNRLGRFPEAASEDLVAGPKRNFQVFDPLDFLAEVTQHIPDRGEHLIRSYGFYSNNSRGLRAKSQGQAGAAAPESASAPSAKEARQRWAALIKRKANQFPDAPSSKRLNNELLAQLALAFYLDMPSDAKNSKTLVFGDKYDDIFNEEVVTAERLLVPLRFYEPLQQTKKEIQWKKRRKEPINEREAFVSRAIFHILNMDRRAEKENLPLNIELNVPVLIEKAIQHIGTIVQTEQTKRGACDREPEERDRHGAREALQRQHDGRGPQIPREPLQLAHCHDGSQPDQSLQPGRRYGLHPAQRAAPESRGEGA